VRKRHLVLSAVLVFLWILGVFVAPLVTRAMFREVPGPLQPLEGYVSLFDPGYLAERSGQAYIGIPPLEGDPIWGSGPLLGAGPLQGADAQGAISTLVVAPLQGMTPILSAGPIGFGPGWLTLPTNVPVAIADITSPPPEPPSSGTPTSGFPAVPSPDPSPSGQSTQTSTPSSGGGAADVSSSAQLTSSTASTGGGGGSSPIVPTFVCISGCAIPIVTPVLTPTCQQFTSGCN
jgi:hypothetical protein